MSRPTLAAATALLVAMALLVACGKKGPPVAPGPADKIIYPHQYPQY
jgi:predicted small lipoprotein YifL